jgi:hypothetical protein
MAGPSMQFKKLLFEHDRMSRDRILYKLSNWLMEQHVTDPHASQCSAVLQMLCNDNGYQSDIVFKNNPNWLVLLGSDQCVSLQRIVATNLAIPSPLPTSLLIEQRSNSNNVSDDELNKVLL